MDENKILGSKIEQDKYEYSTVGELIWNRLNELSGHQICLVCIYL